MSTYEIVNPATEQVVGEAPESTVDDVESAAGAAATAFPAWSRTAPEERAALLNAAADIIRDHVDELVPLVQAETGATLRVTKTRQVTTCVDRFSRCERGSSDDSFAFSRGKLISVAKHGMPVHMDSTT